MCNSFSSGEGYRRHRGISKRQRCCNSFTQLCQRSRRFLGSGLSQSRPAFHMSCIRILALTVKGDRNCNGSNRVEIALRTSLFVVISLISGSWMLKVNTSFLDFHVTPRVFTLPVGRPSSRTSTPGCRSSSGTSSSTDFSFDDHFQSRKLANPSSSESCLRNSITSLEVSRESRTSSTYMESLTVPAASR